MATELRAAPPTAAVDSRRWLALVLLCVANFMVILDSQIVILALPSIAQDLAMTPGAAQWILSANLLTFGGLLLLGGRLADLLGRRRVFITATALFLVVSVLSGLAWNAEVMIFARALHGVSAALMAPAALAILVTTFPEGSERNKALAGWSGIAGIGATVGLIIGGALTDSLGWEWVFYVNVPVAALMLVASPVLLRESHDRGQRRTYDLAGALTATAALVLVVYAVVNAPTAGWGSGRTVGLFVTAAVLIALFVLIERRSAAPLVPLRLFRSRARVGGNLVMVTAGMLPFGLSVTLSVYAQQVLGWSGLEFGVRQAVMPLMAFVGAYVGQAFVTRLGSRPVAVVSLVLMGVGSLLLTGLTVRGDYVGDLLLALFVFGAGLGAASVAASASALSAIPDSDAGVASGINAAALQVGGAFGVAVVSTVMISSGTGNTPQEILASGVRAAAVACVVFAIAGLVLAATLLRGGRPPRAGRPTG